MVEFKFPFVYGLCRTSVHFTAAQGWLNIFENRVLMDLVQKGALTFYMTFDLVEYWAQKTDLTIDLVQKLPLNSRAIW
jgi:hypothetical protein